MSAAELPGDVTTAEWLDALYGTAEGGWASVFAIDHETPVRPPVGWVEATDLHQLAALITARNATACVWLGTALRREPLGDHRRGGATDCTQLPGLWLDIDIDGPAHAGEGLARDLDHALALVRSFPLPPTAIVHSGHGLQPWWLFNELLDIDDETPALMAAWQATWNRLGTAAGAAPDNVSDLARVMRVPGTLNRKKGDGTLQPVPVTVLEHDWTRRYGLDDFESLDTPEPLKPARPTGTVAYIGPARPGDAFNTRHTGAIVLERAGFTLVRRDHSGDTHWQHPWGASNPTSATVYATDGHCALWSPNIIARWPTAILNNGYDPFGLYVHAEHGGDYAAATRELRAQGYGDPAQTLGSLLGASLQGHAAHPALAPPPSPWPDAPTPLVQPAGFPEPPIDAFPAWIGDQIRNVTNQLLCDPMLPTVFALGALSVASLGHFQIQVRAGQAMKTTGLYLVAAGPPASGKSPALDFMMDPVRAYEANAIRAAARAVAEARAAKAIAVKRAKEAVDNAARMADSEDGPERKKTAERLAADAETVVIPPSGELITGDITPERLASIMAENAERFAIVSDEAGVLNVDRYGDKTGATKMEVYLQGFTGQPVAVHRQGADPIRLHCPLLSIVIGVQPEPLAAAFASTEFRRRGFVQRFLVARTDREAANTDYDRDVWDEHAGAAYAEKLTALAAQWGSWGGHALLHLAPATRQRLSAWAGSLKERSATGEELEGESEWVSKMRDSTIRIAALLHLADGNTYDTPVGEATAERAIALAEWFIAHYVHQSEDLAGQAEKLLTALVKITQSSGAEGGVSRSASGTGKTAKSGLSKRGPVGMRRIADYTPALQELVEHGWARLTGVTGPADQPFDQQVRNCGDIEVHPAALEARSSAAGRGCAVQNAGHAISITAPVREGQRDDTNGDPDRATAPAAYSDLSTPSLSVGTAAETVETTPGRGYAVETEPRAISAPTTMAAAATPGEPAATPVPTLGDALWGRPTDDESTALAAPATAQEAQ